jgi:hypothetical protein
MKNINGRVQLKKRIAEIIRMGFDVKDGIIGFEISIENGFSYIFLTEDILNTSNAELLGLVYNVGYLDGFEEYVDRKKSDKPDPPKDGN